MRITNRMMVDSALQSIAESREKSAKLTNQISTGKQYQYASEDPVNASLSLSLRSNLRTIDSFVDTTDSTKDWMTTTDYSLDQLETLATRASTLILKGLNDTLSSTKDASASLISNVTALSAYIGPVDSGQTELSGPYALEVQVVGGARQFRLVDAGGPVSIRSQAGTGYTSGWQPMTSGTYDTGRGLNLTLNATGFSAASTALTYTINSGVSLSPPNATFTFPTSPDTSIPSVDSGQTELNAGNYALEMQVVGGANQFRLIDSSGAPVSIRSQAGTGYTSGWQLMTSGTYNTGRGLQLTLNTAGFAPASIASTALTYTPAGKERATTLGVEMQALVQQAIDIGNTSHNGQFIFAGYKVKMETDPSKPFSMVDYLEDPADPTTTVEYVDVFGKTHNKQMVQYDGDSGIMERSLGPEQKVALNVPGDQSIKDFIQRLIEASEAMVKRPYDFASLQKAQTDLQSSLDVMDQSRTSHGARMRQVESSADYLAQIKLETQNLLSKKEDANVAEAIVSLANEKTTFQAVLEVSQRAISSLSLFDYIQ